MSLYSEWYLSHHGIKGQKWGVRRYENEDGTLTPAGKARYADYDQSLSRRKQKKVSKLQSKEREALESATKLGDKAERYKQKGKLDKARKYELKATEYEADADRYNQKIQNMRKRVEKWTQSKARISDIGKATVARGKEAAKNQLQKANAAIDRYIENSPNNKSTR